MNLFSGHKLCACSWDDWYSLFGSDGSWNCTSYRQYRSCSFTTAALYASCCGNSDNCFPCNSADRQHRTASGSCRTRKIELCWVQHSNLDRTSASKLESCSSASESWCSRHSRSSCSCASKTQHVWAYDFHHRRSGRTDVNSRRRV
jgi:hypothetical protein